MWNQCITNSFTAAAAHYDQGAFLQNEVGEVVLSLLKNCAKSPQSILDLGAGTGVFSQHLAHFFPDACVFSLDKSKGMVTFNKKNRVSANLSVLCADVSFIPVAAQSIECIFSNLMFQWCPSLPTVLKECGRILKKEGSIFISTLGPKTLYELHDSWEKAFGYKLSPQFLEADSFESMLEEAGFSCCKSDRYELSLTYGTVNHLLRDLKTVGAGTLRNTQKLGLVGKKKFQLFTSLYETYGPKDRLPATYDVIYYHGILKKEF